jgi:CMP-N-acetylneuraminic acid synthetase
MKTLCIISARAGSKGVPNKNLRFLDKLPLIAHSFLNAKKTKNIDKIICSTDSKEIAEVAKSYNIDVPFIRPKELADDNTSLISVTKHAMLEMDKFGDYYDIIVQLAPTCPFISPINIEKSIKFCKVKDVDCAVSLKRIEHDHPYRARVVSEDGFFKNFITSIDVEESRFHSRQDLPELYATSGGLYTRKRKLLEDYDGRDFAMGFKRKAVVLNDIESINIDRLIDFEFSEFIINKKNQKI